MLFNHQMLILWMEGVLLLAHTCMYFLKSTSIIVDFKLLLLWPELFVLPWCYLYMQVATGTSTSIIMLHNYAAVMFSYCW